MDNNIDNNINNNMNINMNTTICSPNVAYEFKNTFTCFSLKQLIYIAKMYNNWISNKRKLCKKSDKNTCIDLTYAKLIKINGKYNEMQSEDPQIKSLLWKEICKRLYPLCKNDESCWIELDFLNNPEITSNSHKNIVKKIKLLTFKPKKIYNERDWLNTTDIENVLRQYECVYKGFKFLGAVPSDFYKIKNINISDFNKYNKLGMILNLDSYKEAGSHWVAVYIDKKKKTLEYFDSTGNHPNNNIKHYINQLLSYFPNYKYLQNNYKHQFLDSECGVYSIYYIIHRLLGFDFEYLTSNIIKDNDMQQFRNYIFI